MSTAATEQPDTHDAHAHPPHLAHHFETMGQQFDAGKLGMWVFLATEILMFGGLFCAYAVYRANNPDVFAFAHKELNTTLGAINTVVLIASSLTMAWAVRCSQLGQSKALIALLSLSLMGGFGFLAIKTIEYHKKYEHHLWVGTANEYHPNFKGEKHVNHPTDAAPGEGHAKDAAPESPAPAQRTTTTQVAPVIDRSAVAPPLPGPSGTVPAVIAGQESVAKKHHAVHHEDLSKFDQSRVHIFFQVYYMMTGLHGLHVVIGMSLMFWLLLRAVRPASRGWVFMLGPAAISAFIAYVGAITGISMLIYIGLGVAAVFGCLSFAVFLRKRSKANEGKGDFGPNYFIPVDLVGLYWHVVDLIWIFLFPLLYLIH